MPGPHRTGIRLFPLLDHDLPTAGPHRVFPYGTGGRPPVRRCANHARESRPRLITSTID